ncbi:hypothetical protein ACJZ2D_016433 [Fusarium nematophilum]
MARSHYSCTESSNRNRTSIKRGGIAEEGKFRISSSPSSMLTPISEDQPSQTNSQSADDALFHALMKEYRETRCKLLEIECNLRELGWKRLRDQIQGASLGATATTRSRSLHRTDQSFAGSWSFLSDSCLDVDTRQEAVGISDTYDYKQRKREEKIARNINRRFARENP